MPATTSSPCAFIKHSPKNALSPELGLRVKATPVPLVSPIFPKTMATTLTAVPQESGIPYSRRYVIARAPNHEEKTALIAMRNWSSGSSGNSFFVSSLTNALKLATSSRRCRASRCVSWVTPTSAFLCLRIASKCSRGTPMTMLPNMETNRR